MVQKILLLLHGKIFWLKIHEADNFQFYTFSKLYLRWERGKYNFVRNGKVGGAAARFIVHRRIAGNMNCWGDLMALHSGISSSVSSTIRGGDGGCIFTGGEVRSIF